ncbi:MAG: 30S ribosomal protein S2 [Candidatus Aminicenantes bacterium]|nr:30S ribosomal protein S2 [Candidatus Aminicenantes bacterium]MDH5714841.1 30S ribosomal protein S2 [Candidatus Aminicenantes bacterium]
MININMKELLEAGVHFGHQTKRWNPKMKKYIFGQRNGIYIIDLQQTVRLFKEAIQFLTELAANGGKILFVGTKNQAQDIVKEEAERCDMYYVNQRWLGGLLTNHVTIKKSIERLKQLEEMSTNGRYEGLTKKEIARLEKQRGKLDNVLCGIKKMNGLPDALFVIDIRKERIAVNEANKLNIKVVAVVDTNCNPDPIDYIIPGNDDAIRSIHLIISKIAEAVIEGNQLFESRKAEEIEAPEPETAEAASASPTASDAAEKPSSETPSNEKPSPEKSSDKEKTGHQ